MGMFASVFNGPAQYQGTGLNAAPGMTQNQLQNYNALGANVQTPVTADMYNQAYGGTNAALGQQAQMAQALAAQNGIANQSAVFGQQQGLANMLATQAAGGGPNPAQAQLAQNTGANVSNQAALMAGQRGASANAGLMARNAALQGAQTQQQAVGQAATLQAQQQLGFEQALQNQQAAMGNLAGTQVGQQIGATQNLTGAQQAQQNALMQGIGAQNTANVANQSNLNATNLGMAQNLNSTQAAIQANLNSTQQAMAAQNNANAAGIIGGALGAAGAVGAGAAGSSGGGAGAAAAAYKGGKATKEGFENPKLDKVSFKDRYAAEVEIPPHLNKISTIYHGNSLHSPRYSYGGDVGSKLKAGGPVPGQAKMKGDHPANDTVNAKLSPGEVVIPKSIMESKDPIKGAADFVAALQKKKGSNNHQSEFKAALARAVAGRKK